MAVDTSTVAQERTDEPALMPRLLRSDLRALGRQAGREEIRYLVDTYYQLQEHRKAHGNQALALAKADEPNLLVTWAGDAFLRLEADIKVVMDAYTAESELGRWCRSITGIGPIIAAGLMAHIDITKAPTVGHIWRFAGLDPTVKWGKGQKRPWNASLKVLTWKVGKSLVMTSHLASSFYGPLYRERKEYETAKNERGDYAEQAAERLSRLKKKAVRSESTAVEERAIPVESTILDERAGDLESTVEDERAAKESAAYRATLMSGKLPPAAIDARARRWTVKLLLAHFHAQAYRLHYGTEPPKPYAIAFLNHAHEISSP